jgi:PGF-pre-PGF domain-containing protein
MGKPKKMIFFFATLIVLMFVTSAAPQSSESKIKHPVYSSGERDEIIPIIIVLKDQPQQSQTSELSEIGRGYTWVNAIHFSTFSLAGARTIAVQSRQADPIAINDGIGGGIATSEPYENIAKAQRYEKSLIANLPVTYEFNAPELGVYEIAVTGKDNENDISLWVEALKGRSKVVFIDAPGKVYKNLNMWSGIKRIKEAIIKFKVENSWLVSNNLEASDVKMIKWDGSKWAQLETLEISADSSYTYFEAKTDTFSSFAITVLKGVAIPMITPSGTAPAATGAPQVTEKASGKAEPINLVVIIAVIALIAIAVLLYLKRK